MAEQQTFTGETERREVALTRALFVSFKNGARTFWHSHPGVQVLVVTEGAGWFQYDGEPKFELAVGDVVEVRAGVKHWHGAQRGRDMTHLATLDGGTDWLEEVEDAD
jgi:quercetin dioxygenase-like cupin family protein